MGAAEDLAVAADRITAANAAASAAGWAASWSVTVQDVTAEGVTAALIRAVETALAVTPSSARAELHEWASGSGWRLKRDWPVRLLAQAARFKMSATAATGTGQLYDVTAAMTSGGAAAVTVVAG